MKSDYLTLSKGDAVKYIDPSSSILEVLKKDGWKVDGEEDKPRRGRPPKEQVEK